MPLKTLKALHFLKALVAPSAHIPRTVRTAVVLPVRGMSVLVPPVGKVFRVVKVFKVSKVFRVSKDVNDPNAPSPP